MFRPSRFSGSDWADQLKDIMLVGIGGIGSWTALNLSRIGHNLILVDGDSVDETNVHGGQMYRTLDIGDLKVNAVASICRSFGCVAGIDAIAEMWRPSFGAGGITITGLDNMAARRAIFDTWKKELTEDSLLIDGRLLVENAEIFCIQNNKDQIEEYEKWLFDDSEIEEADCSTKQSTYAAMGIASLITASLCNFLTNRKLRLEFREVPFHQTLYYPAFHYQKNDLLIIKPYGEEKDTSVLTAEPERRD